MYRFLFEGAKKGEQRKSLSQRMEMAAIRTIATATATRRKTVSS